MVGMAHPTVMAVSLKISLEVVGADLERIAARERDFTPFHRNTNVLMLSRMSQRLAARITGDIRTGNLLRSLAIGGPNNIEDVGRNYGEIGSSLEYARQVDEGGPIRPVPPGRALAVPVTERTKRSKLWPRDVDPERKLLVFIPRKGKAPMLVHPDEGEDLAWVLVAGTFFEGHHFALFTERDEKDVYQMFWRHLRMSDRLEDVDVESAGGEGE